MFRATSSVPVARAITHAGRKDFAFYAETDIPVFSPEMAIPVSTHWSSRPRDVMKNSAITIPMSWFRRWDCAGNRSTTN